ncbi:hypothetical protein SAMN05444481_1232 [Flavobacterium frigidimaris]|nr:hypothetical protein SAMN05444481_1232 [Flavobacterium frigidimaris]
MLYLEGLLIIGIMGGILIWSISKRKKMVVLFLLLILLLLILPWILLFLAYASEAEFPD